MSITTCCLAHEVRHDGYAYLGQRDDRLLLLPEKRKVGGSTPPLTTGYHPKHIDADLRKRSSHVSHSGVPGRRRGPWVTAVCREISHVDRTPASSVMPKCGPSRGSRNLSKLWTRWVLAVTLSAMAFAVCWACLEFGVHAEEAVALGWAILPFSVVLALSGVWADSVRRDADKGRVDADSKPPRIDQRQRAGDKAQQIQIGGDLRINEKDS
jgi:hypothetical protein